MPDITTSIIGVSVDKIPLTDTVFVYGADVPDHVVLRVAVRTACLTRPNVLNVAVCIA